MSDDSLLEFPCEFCVKAMGLAADDFDALVAAIVREQVPDLPAAAVRSRPSRGGKYLAVSVTFTATSRAQLDAIYQALSAHERVVMAL